MTVIIFVPNKHIIQVVKYIWAGLNWQSDVNRPHFGDTIIHTQVRTCAFAHSGWDFINYLLALALPHPTSLSPFLPGILRHCEVLAFCFQALTSLGSNLAGINYSRAFTRPPLSLVTLSLISLKIFRACRKGAC